MLVISPLLALMKDQFDTMERLGLPVIKLDSQLRGGARKAALAQIASGGRLLVMTTPETLTAPDASKALAAGGVALAAVDEAHCISEWGYDFRPAYLQIGERLRGLGAPPALALTATATTKVRSAIIRFVGLREPRVVSASPHRDNLAFDVLQAGAGARLRALARLALRVRRPGIIYCSTTRDVDEVFTVLQRFGVPSYRYHGKMSGTERRKSQEGFMTRGRRTVMVATNAFGLGIDKPDIRYVMHYQSPASLEQYVQEAGRAGRDGRRANCIMLFAAGDRAIHEALLARSRVRPEQLYKLAKALSQWAQENKVPTLAALALTADLGSRTCAALLALLEESELVKWSPEAIEVLTPPEEFEERARALGGQFQTLRSQDARRLDAVHDYALLESCRATMLEEYFGEESSGDCGICDHCRGGSDRPTSFWEPLTPPRTPRGKECEEREERRWWQRVKTRVAATRASNATKTHATAANGAATRARVTTANAAPNGATVSGVGTRVRVTVTPAANDADTKARATVTRVTEANATNVAHNGATVNGADTRARVTVTRGAHRHAAAKAATDANVARSGATVSGAGTKTRATVTRAANDAGTKTGATRVAHIRAPANAIRADTNAATGAANGARAGATANAASGATTKARATVATKTDAMRVAEASAAVTHAATTQTAHTKPATTNGRGYKNARDGRGRDARGGSERDEHRAHSRSSERDARSDGRGYERNERRAHWRDGERDGRNRSERGGDARSHDERGSDARSRDERGERNDDARGHDANGAYKTRDGDGHGHSRVRDGDRRGYASARDERDGRGGRDASAADLNATSGAHIRAAASVTANTATTKARATIATKADATRVSDTNETNAAHIGATASVTREAAASAAAMHVAATRANATATGTVTPACATVTGAATQTRATANAATMQATRATLHAAATPTASATLHAAATPTASATASRARAVTSVALTATARAVATQTTRTKRATPQARATSVTASAQGVRVSATSASATTPTTLEIGRRAPGCPWFCSALV